MCINISAKRMEKGVWCANNKQECMQRPNLLCRVPLFLGGVVVDGVRASARPALGAAQVLFMGCLCPILSSCSLPTLSLTGMQGSLLRNALTVLLAVVAISWLLPGGISPLPNLVPRAASLNTAGQRSAELVHFGFLLFVEIALCPEVYTVETAVPKGHREKLLEKSSNSP